MVKPGKVSFSFDVDPLWEVSPSEETAFFKTAPLLKALHELPEEFEVVGNKLPREGGCACWRGFLVQGPNGKKVFVAPQADGRRIRAWGPGIPKYRPGKFPKFEVSQDSTVNSERIREAMSRVARDFVEWLKSVLA